MNTSQHGNEVRRGHDRGEHGPLAPTPRWATSAPGGVPVDTSTVRRGNGVGAGGTDSERI